eukprot:CAMPEP_0197303738 /NCGR_PEP_ID=MMETSP0890-20130614/51845_1 /TAXON_ID=44058 ORGANISM="Aureoumbra lagunensis, Strain CCMP1510" /NCGR_SAMPLE_ID=MMETSP0890 /ASSEMBLY_ACC=CAM_ASM_000533 /LENGTH=377 /DNA_ID=CAMNT_0042783631 /DNA_START=108 /DNA_END=1241 /DNA_ORIENTATION=+
MDTEIRPSFVTAASGYLEKKGSKAPYRWQKRYFLGTGKYLRYYESEACSKLLAAIDMSDAEIVEEGNKILCIKTKEGSQIALRAPDQDQRDEWIAALEILRRALDSCQTKNAVCNSDSAVQPPLEEETKNTNPIVAADLITTAVPSLGTRKSTVTKLNDRSHEIRESMIATPRESFPAAAAGFLEKRARSKLARWQLRFFVACHHYLRYYSSDQPGADLLGVIDLCGVAVVGQGVDDEASPNREFFLKLADAEIHLKAATPLERAQWVSSLIEMQHQVAYLPRDPTLRAADVENSINNSASDDHASPVVQSPPAPSQTISVIISSSTNSVEQSSQHMENTNTNNNLTNSIPGPPSSIFPPQNTSHHNRHRKCCGLLC